jgi:hypothetical protein
MARARTAITSRKATLFLVAAILLPLVLFGGCYYSITRKLNPEPPDVLGISTSQRATAERRGEDAWIKAGSSGSPSNCPGSPTGGVPWWTDAPASGTVTSAPAGTR